MDLLLANISSPPVLFFFLGGLAVIARSDLDIPDQISKFLSLYLLFAIGFKGGVALAQSSITVSLITTLGSAVAMSMLVPVGAFFVIRRWGMTAADAAAIAATYGSISAVTFITATGYLDTAGEPWSGHMVAAMALMEAPAIVVAIILFSLRSKGHDLNMSRVFHESFLNGSVFLILGSMGVGCLSGDAGAAMIFPFVKELFAGILCLFLLDMGISAFREVDNLRNQKEQWEPPYNKKIPLGMMVSMGIVFPIVSAAIALAAVSVLNISTGDATLLVVLSASASYIAVPAAMRLSLPESNSSIYLPMSLAITFPFNLIVGIPTYHKLATLLA
jgi:hypothetical protein